jgi:hypothetical protein
MRRIMNFRAIFLSLNFEFELCGQALKIRDHCLKLVNLPTVLVNVKIPQAKEVNLPTSTMMVKVFQVKELCTGIHWCASSEVATLFGVLATIMKLYGDQTCFNFAVQFT